ncbi:MAG: hypothetical protein IKF79_03415, partial [Methanosphaera sp.]|nr:hypothetical protein [Methanosphaera sp.]
TLLFLLVGVSAISASEVSDDNTVIQDTADTVAPEITTSDKIVDTTTKNIKTEEQTTDLYVSDTSGSDDNSGTNTSPYKTIQKALDTTNADSTFNIHIAEGTYKGLGNTNLTVNGNYNINIIGSGNAVIDGEAKYEINMTPGYTWGSSEEWYPYYNDSGNWIMNITSGTGIITISNLTITNSWSPYTENASSYKDNPVGGVNNHATLEVTNVNFISNHGGLGSSLRNYNNSLMTVENCSFLNNSKGLSTGNYGTLYNIGTCYINNSQFINNLQRWGTITNDKTMYVTNTIFTSNRGYDGDSTYKGGTGIYADSSHADFYHTYDWGIVTTVIDNCTFMENQQADIVVQASNLTVTNSVFNHSSGIYALSSVTNTSASYEIINNIFANIENATIMNSLSGAGHPLAIAVSNDYIVTVKNNIIDVPQVPYSTGIAVKSNATVINNTLNNVIHINGNYNNIINNTINTTREYAITGTNARNNLIVNNTLISNLLIGNSAVSGVYGTIENNTPLPDNYTISENNYNEYFNEKGLLKTNTITNYSTIYLEGDFINKSFTFNNIKTTVNSRNATIYNGSITLLNTSNVQLNSITINDNDDNIEYALLVNSTKSTIRNMKINITSNKPVRGIIVNGAENSLETNTINITGPSNPLTGEYADTVGEIITSNTNSTDTLYVYGINNNQNGTIIGRIINGEKTTINQIQINSGRVNVYTSEHAIGTLIKNVNNSTFLTQGEIYSNLSGYGLKIEDTNNILLRTYLTKTISNETMHSVYIAGEDNKHLNNITFNLFGIVNQTSNNGVGLYLENLDDVNFLYSQNSNFEFRVYGTNNTGVISKNVNNIYLRGNTYERAIVKYIQFVENGDFMKIINNTNVTVKVWNISASENGINIIDSKDVYINFTAVSTNNAYPIVLNNTDNSNITNNYLLQEGGVSGNNAILDNGENTIIENNTPAVFTLTDENFYEYFDENNTIIDQTKATIVNIASDIYNKDMKFTQQTLIQNKGNYTIYNSTISFIGNSTGSSLNNININTTGDKASVVYAERNVLLDNCTIFHNSTSNLTRTINITVRATNATITNTNITTIGREIKTDDGTPSNIMIYDAYNQEYTRVYQVNNTLNISYSESDGEGTTQLVYNLQARHTYRWNNITINGDNNAVFIRNFETIELNNITINSNNNATAITYNIRSNNGVNIRGNNITINAGNDATLTNINTTRNLLIENNLIQSTSNTTNLAEVINAMSTALRNNNITINNTNGNILNFTKNNLNIYNNTILINCNEEEQTPTIITINGNIYDNYILTPTLAGNDAILSQNGNVFNNTPILELTVDNIDTIAGETINITARINIANRTLTDINKGKVTFKVNGRTLKDTNGKVIYAKVVNGVATIENYVVPEDWSKDGTTIQAVYSGSTQCEKLTSEKTNITVATPEATLTITPITDDVQTGSTITLKAKVAVGDNAITTGKIVFKVNGKTVKDTNGKVIYAKVDANGEVSVDYTIPESFKVGTYNIEAVFTAPSYDKITSNTTMTVVKS